MIGALFKALAEEVIGDDPENRRIAGLPYKASTDVAGLDLVSGTLDLGL